MKYIALIIGLLVVGCGTPVKELTLEEKQKRLRDSVFGQYEIKDGPSERFGGPHKFVFYKDGTRRRIGKSVTGGDIIIGATARWSIVDGELHVKPYKVAYVEFYRINPNKSIVLMGYIDKEGKRTKLNMSDEQATFKKIK